MRHGLRAGQLPKGAAYIKRECDTLRREIEQAVLEQHGEIGLYQAAVVQSAMRWERHGLLVQRWLRMEAGTMDAAQRLAYSRDIARASENRDRCLKELGLDANGRQNVLDVLYSTPADPPESPPTSPTLRPGGPKGEGPAPNTRKTKRP